MIEQVLDHLNNYFIVENGNHKGHYTISGGHVDVDFLQENQYYRIMGSVFNDGVHQFTSDPDEDLTDEEFDGVISAMAIPKAVEDLTADIGAWCTENAPSAYVSEAFGGYSRTRASSAGTGAPVSWEDVFRARLNRWRKL